MPLLSTVVLQSRQGLMCIPMLLTSVKLSPPHFSQMVIEIFLSGFLALYYKAYIKKKSKQTNKTKKKQVRQIDFIV